MFGLTKRQFLKRSKQALQETGAQILAFRGLKNQESKGSISLIEAQRRQDNLRNNVEDTFSRFEKLNPPSKCKPLKQEIIKTLILFHESIVAYSESLQAKEEELQEQSQQLREKSDEELQKYQDLSIKLSREVDKHLQKK